MDFISPVLNLIGSQLLAEYAQINGISAKLDTWARKLRMIQAVMDSAEEKQINGNPAADHWLSDLRDVAYDMEDLLDHFSVNAKLNMSKAHALSRSSRLPYSLISCCSAFRPRNLISSHCMANDIEEVDRRLEEVIANIAILGFVQNQGGGSLSPADIGQGRSFTTSLPEPKFVGREKQMEELLARLTGSEATGDSVRPFTVVSIVGMGGIGKTTMAQQLYSHESFDKESFPVKAWVCVSDVFDRVAITKSILDQAAPFSSGMENDPNKLQNLLKEKLSGKKFFIVLDDVWNDRYAELESLLKPLYSGGKGSKILLTTRNLQVAKLVGDQDPRRLDILSIEESLCLLAYHSIGEENFDRDLRLRDVAVQLVEKCKGLPLSIKAIGGLLRRLDSNDEKWKKVLSDNIWNKEDEPETIPRALKLSYVHLPLHLKRCFAACALFPKDYIFDQDEVIRVWTVQGLLHKGTSKTYRDVGMENLRHLEAVSLIEKAKDVKNSYSMHDLFNDLAKSVMVGVYFCSDESKEGPLLEGSLGKVRHAMMVAQQFETFMPRRFDVYRSMKKLRTFILSPMSGFHFSYVTVPWEVIQDLIIDKKNLRMLSLRCSNIHKVPDRIGELKLLRSIDLSHTFIEALPESICDLVELQSLLLRWCRSLKSLPRNIHKLTKLLHLDITGTDELMEMPPHIGDLTNLEILSDFIVGKEASLKNLGPLKCLQRELHLRNLLAVDDVEDARIAKLCEKEAIHELSFDWRSKSETSSENDHQLKVLEHLQPPKKVESLTIHGYGGKRFPSWFGNPCMNNVVSITLTGCKSVHSLPTFGRLPSLESLDISDLEAVSSIGEEFYGTERPFQSLRSLRFENMGAWEKWSSCGYSEKDKPFPCLRELKVKKCPNLKECPTLSLPSLVEIDIDGCNEGLLNCLVDLTSMTKMNIRKVPELVHFDGRFSTSWVVLKEMSIKHCPQFKSFIDEDAGQRVSPELKNLEKLPDDLSETSAVDRENLTSFPSAELPPALRKLTLRGCPSLPSRLICSRLPESLEELFLKKLEGLVSITGIPAEGTRICRSLRVLEIRYCKSVTTLPDSLQNLSALSELVLKHFPELEIDCFPALPCNLSSLVLKSCPKVKSLPHDMHTVTSLKTLSISYCDGITGLPSGGLPPNLEVLTIRVCRKLNQPIEDWGLCRLAALRELRLCGEMECVDEMECFPSSPNAWSHLLPSSLAELVLQKMKKLERVSDGLKTHLASLRDLWISECPRMRYLPDDGIPGSLERLGIIDCPVLGKRLSKYMPIIQHIPDLHISNSSDTSAPSSGASTPCSPDSIDSSYFSDGIIVL